MTIRNIRFKAAGIAVLGLLCIAPVAAANSLSTADVAAAYNSAAGEIAAPAAKSVKLPVNLEDGVRIGTGVSAVTVTPEAGGRATALRGGKGVYKGADVSTVVETMSEGARIATVSTDSGTAQQAFGYDLGLPAGATTRPVGDGADIVTSDGTVIASIAPPWAKDAKGKSLPTSYTIEGNRLTQTVDTAGAVFPIVADPRVQGLGFLGITGQRVWFTRHETETLWRQQFAGGVVSLAGILVCGIVPPPLDAVCALAVATVAADFYTNIREAHARHNCLTLTLGLPASINWDDADGSYCEH